VPHPRTDTRVDLWWSGKHDNHGGNVQVITAPNGWPLWTSPVRPGREHDTTALRAHGVMLPLLAACNDDDLRVLGDLGYEGEAATITVAFKKPKNRACTDVQQQFNRAHNAVRAIAKRGNSLPMSWSSSRRPFGCGKRFAGGAHADEAGEPCLPASEYGVERHSGARALGRGCRSNSHVRPTAASAPNPDRSRP
jgi:hypothetical protein